MIVDDSAWWWSNERVLPLSSTIMRRLNGALNFFKFMNGRFTAAWLCEVDGQNRCDLQKLWAPTCFSSYRASMAWFILVHCLEFTEQALVCSRGYSTWQPRQSYHDHHWWTNHRTNHRGWIRHDLWCHPTHKERLGHFPLNRISCIRAVLSRSCIACSQTVRGGS